MIENDLKSRLKNIISMMKVQNNGADIHTATNILSQATMLLTLLERGEMEHDKAAPLVTSIEKHCVEFFKNKFGKK